ARRCFRQALEGPLSLVQQAQVEMGMGQSYLLADRRANAKKHLANAVKSLRGPEADECQLMLNLLDGNPLQADPIVLARVEQFLSPSLLALASHGPSAPGKLGVDVRRAAWHAQPLRGNHDPMGNPKRITIHHSAEPFTSRTLGATLAEVRRIQGIHQDNQRWADIGYHFLIDPAGRIVEGRSIGIKGAHAGNAALNQGNLGICLLGNFAAQPNRGSAYAHAQSPTTVQLRALLDLVESMRAEYGIPRHKVESHGELKETECPGARLDSWVRSYRANP
ncbi:MAG: peptidoglycan recognition protein family protein, partial [Planctomycetes bacterium]|nr:peptidoglycan recognition protein family protein [Planctomycetota bacterium]